MPGDIISLPARNLLRGITWGLPSGQSIAKRIGAPALNGDNDEFLRGLRDYDTSREKLNLDDSTPLWMYCLREGFVLGENGFHLGPVGGRIVGEVFIGLLQLDKDSYLNADRRWRPTLPQRNGKVTGDFKMIDFLTFAGVAPDQRGAADAEDEQGRGGEPPRPCFDFLHLSWSRSVGNRADVRPYRAPSNVNSSGTQGRGSSFQKKFDGSRERNHTLDLVSPLTA